MDYLEMAAGDPWPDKFLRANWAQLLAAVNGREDWMPLAMPAGPRGKLVIAPALGCGHYGCVYPTESSEGVEQAVVCKVTSDPSETAFVRLAMQWPWPEGIVRYYAVTDIAGSRRGRPISAIWRESAFDVGKPDHNHYAYKEFLRYHSIYARAAGYLREQSMKPTWAKNAVAAERLSSWSWREVTWEDGIDPQRESSMYGRRAPKGSFFFKNRHSVEYRIAAALRVCATAVQMMGSTAYAYAIGQALEYYLHKGVLLADVHQGNFGRVLREEYDAEGLLVITDPGHAVVIPNPEAHNL